MKMMIYGQFDHTGDKEFWLITKYVDAEPTEQDIMRFLDYQTGFRDVFDNVIVKITTDNELTVLSSYCF